MIGSDQITQVMVLARHTPSMIHQMGDENLVLAVSWGNIGCDLTHPD